MSSDLLCFYPSLIFLLLALRNYEGNDPECDVTKGINFCLLNRLDLT